MDSMILLSSKSMLLGKNVQVGSPRFLSSNITVPVLGIVKTNQFGISSLPSLRSNCSSIALRRGQRESQPHLNRGVSLSRKVTRNFTSETSVAETVSTTRECVKVYEINGAVVLQKVGFFSFTNMAFLNLPFLYSTVVDAFYDIWSGRNVSLELVSSDQVDPESRLGKTSGQSYLKWSLWDGLNTIETRCTVKFKWNSTLGFPGAFRIKNMRGREFLLKSLTLSIPGHGEVHFQCNSWIFRASPEPIERVFFANKSYLPEETPVGLRELRESDLKDLRGDGTGERKLPDLIYDYDVYNDLGQPDKDAELRREVLGGSKEFPYPRRCRTGRPRIETAPEFETRTSSIYIPPDERLPYNDFTDIEVHLILAITNSIIPNLVYLIYGVLKSFDDVTCLYEQTSKSADNSPRKLSEVSNPVRYIQGLVSDVLHDTRLGKVQRPHIIEAHEEAGRSDDEFALKTLAGVNPTVIQCLEKVRLFLALANSIIPNLVDLYNGVFKSFEDVTWLYEPASKSADNSPRKLSEVDNPVQYIQGLVSDMWNDKRLGKFQRPHIIRAHEGAWRSDEEFARQTLAGMNPIVIECLQKFPPSSSFDEKMYGPQKSTISAQQIRKNLEDLSVNQAIEEKRLFIVDYYDAYMPFVERINKLPNDIKIYASRTVYFLTKEGTLKPVAIELCLPPIDDNAAVRKVYTPDEDGTEEGAVWQLAKVHVKVNDAGYHQLVSHWLKTHCISEPFIIANHRQLSKMHPVYKLLIPHFLGTMDINQAARLNLISASGIIEQCFAPGRYSTEMSSNAYKQWKFNEQGLEADLLKRGMAVRDEKAPNGLKLVISDYPYAVDGIEIWFALKEWVSEYMKICYKNDSSVKRDNELQAWWDEIVNVGHGDLKDDPSKWYKMDSLDEAVQVVTTIIWTASAHHAAVNFGQYSYGGYMPNMPTTSRRLIPDKGTPEYDELLKNPNRFFFDTVPSPKQALLVMAVFEVLSKHTNSEIYVGQSPGSTTDRVEDPRVEQIFKKFSNDLKKIEENIKERNENCLYKNRSGPAKLPYTLLSPGTSDLSKSGGLTGRGVSNSISI